MIDKIFGVLNKENDRQKNSISLIASENIASNEVRTATSSTLTNKYAEGYPHKRYYAGCEYADEIETLAIDLVKKIFRCKYANVQPHSGSQANAAVYHALLKPGDTILSLELKAGGHLTHGAPVSSVASTYNIVHYSLDSNGLIDMQQVAKLADQHKPKLIITGASAYPRNWDWKAFRAIADSISDSRADSSANYQLKTYLMADVAHTAGLIAGKVADNPIDYVDVATSTTHKTLRGTRGGIIFSNNEELGTKIDRAVFPGIQGGPLMNIIAAKAVGFAQNLDPEFAIYAHNVVSNAQMLANKIMKAGGRLITNGTDNHLMILDCQSFEMNANEAQDLLDSANVYISKSALLTDTSWVTPNGIRIGTPYITTLGITDITDFADLFVEALTTKNSSKLGTFVKDTAPNLFSKFLSA